MVDPAREICVCIYCANFELCLIAGKNIRKESNSNIKRIRSEMLSAV